MCTWYYMRSIGLFFHKRSIWFCKLFLTGDFIHTTITCHEYDSISKNKNYSDDSCPFSHPVDGPGGWLVRTSSSLLTKLPGVHVA